MVTTPSGQLERAAAETVERLGSMAETLCAHPHHTVEPAITDSEEATDVLQQLGVQDDRLLIEEQLGEGGMGVVHLATQTSLRRKVAVKMLRPGKQQPHASAKLLREAYITGSLEHPNVMPIYDAQIDSDGSPRIVLKRIEGEAWSHLLDGNDKPFSDETLEGNLRILMQVCHAVHFAHDRGIVHRDLKPDNVMIGEFGQVYLMDWGIALRLNELVKHGGASRELAGTPSYMAPEMVQPHLGPTTARTDVYLLGAMLYELLCGEPPHSGPTPVAMVRKILRSSPTFRDGAPAELVTIARRAMAPKAEDRYEGADQFRVALEDFMQHRSSSRLASKAGETLEALAAVIRNDDDPATKHAKIEGLFGACRFGFAEALQMWPENAPAADGLDLALALVVEHEAEHGDPDAAAAMLTEMVSPPDDLAESVRAAQLRKDDESRRIAELEELKRMFDPQAELRARWIVTSGLAILGAFIPVGTMRLVDPNSEAYAPLFVVPACFLVVIVSAAWWKRHAIAHTTYNSWVVVMVVTALSGQMLFHAGAALMALPVVSSIANVALLWALLAAMLAAIADRLVAPVALGYLACFFAIVLLDVNRRDANMIMCGGHLITAITVFAIWRPRLPES
jgi:hypothetical protein